MLLLSKAIQILITRLPELPISWRAILQRLINGQEVHITTIKGFWFTWLTQLAKARQIKEMAEEYGYIVNYSEHTRQLANKPIKKLQSVDESSRTTTTSTAKVLCSGCGRDNHLVAKCRFKSTEFFNSYPYAYRGSKAHKLLLAKYPDATVVPFTELSKDTPRSSASGLSSSKYGPKSTGVSQTISDILSTMYSDTSDNKYIDVFVSATLQTRIRTSNYVKALLDTGSLARDFVAFRTLQALNLEPYFLTHGSRLVCSGDHVFGDEVQRKQIFDLCEEFRDIFSNELDETPAIVPPFDWKVDETKWKVRANRAPPRPQTTANQADIVIQIKTLSQQGIIEKSQASHYSQIHMVPKLCVKFRNLNDCTEDASFAIPHTKQMLSRIGSWGLIA
jgi:hypothetical protein